ncbi:phage head protein [Erythrobacter sp. A30-3]|nr:phage head protein [Erythrobacter sp. A30-3]
MSDHPSAISGVANRPFPEQIAYFRRKLGNLVPTQRWDDVLAAQHDNAFMVAGAAKADLLTDLAAAVDKAIAEGRGIEDFRKDFRAIVKRHGWTGWTGEGSVKGEAWRVKTILRTNAYTSYSAGRYAQLKARGLAFWVYRHGGSAEPREQHLHEWDGLILPSDHPFWQKAFPPSDWGCSCYVVGAHSMAQAIRLGGDPKKKLRDDWDKPDPATGAPEGIGRGWDYAPGASVVNAVLALAGKIGSMEHQIAKAFMASLPARQADAMGDAYRALPSTAEDARRYARRVYEPQPELPDLPPVRTMGLLRRDQAKPIGTAIDREVSGFDFSLDTSAVGHVIRNHSNPRSEWSAWQRAVSPSDFAMLPKIASQPLTPIDTVSELGEPMAEQRLTLGNDTYIVRWAIRGKRRRTLALKTMFIKVKKRGPRPTS